MSDRVATTLRSLAAEMSWDEEGRFRLGEGPAIPASEAAIALRSHLYARYFCDWRPDGPPSAVVSGDEALVRQFVDATCGASTWESGWRVASREGNWAFVGDGRVLLFADATEQIRPPGAEAGTAVDVRMPCARENLSPGFFYVISPDGPIRRDGPFLRLYMNVTSAIAPAVLRALVLELPESRVRFEAKFANDPARYARTEPGVVYVEPEGYRKALALLLRLRERQSDGWRTGTPLFAKAVAPGLAAAESPERGADGVEESFGQHRCRLLADGVLAGLAQGERSPEAWDARVAEAFAKAGIDVAAPHRHRLPESAF